MAPARVEVRVSNQHPQTEVKGFSKPPLVNMREGVGSKCGRKTETSEAHWNEGN
jgi:hypothetical protein